MDAYEKYDSGELLNSRYSKVSDISEGSYGLVSLAKDIKKENALVAVKFIFPIDYKRPKQYKHLSNTTGRATSSPAKLRSNVETSGSVKKSLKAALSEESAREIAIHEILGHHANIPSLVDHFDSYLVLEYCSRGDLYEAMQNDLGPATSQDIKDVFDQILNAISYCHSKSVFHRDLKPENILIAHDWTIKVCDWGLATTQRIVTNPNEFDIGSERYMAPELFDPALKSYDAEKVDMWSLGIILLTLVFHKNPFQIANYSDKRFLQFSANREALFDFFSTMTGGMFSALRFCLNLDPTNRDLSSFRNELQNVKYFTIDEEYWAQHSDEEEDNGYEEDEEEEEEEDIELHPEGGMFEFDKDREPEEQKPADVNLEIKSSIPAAPHKRHIQLLVNDVPESDTLDTNTTGLSAREDDSLPYNRRADALLISNAHAQPIPISGGANIRNTRKPFGVASFTRSGAFASRFNGHNQSGSHGGKFRREDFFTPRSIFALYMDKYGENKDKEHHRVYDKKKKWGRGHKRQSWKKKGQSSAHGQNGHGSANSHQDGQSRKKHYSKKRKARPLSTNDPLAHSAASSVPAMNLNQTQHPNLHPGGCRNSGKYIPPFLRSPQYANRSPAVEAVTEEIDALVLNDDEVFHLESDFPASENDTVRARAGGPSGGNGVFPDSILSDFRAKSASGRRGLAVKFDSCGQVADKYIPPFRRESVGHGTDRRKPLTPHNATHGLVDAEAAQSAPGERWLLAREWQGYK